MQKQVILLAGGSSVIEGLNKDLWNKIKDIEVWSLNFAYKFMPFLPKKIVWTDRKVFTDNCKELQLLYHKGVDLECRFNELYSMYPEIKVHKIEKNKQKFDNKLDNIFIGTLGLTGFFALSLAIKEKYDKIYLLGYDFGTPSFNDKLTHWYQNINPNEGYSKVISGGVANTAVYMDSNSSVKSSISDFDVYKEWDNKIINVSSKTNVHQFKIISYDEFFNQIGESKLNGI